MGSRDTNILSHTTVADVCKYTIPAMQWAVGALFQRVYQRLDFSKDSSVLRPSTPDRHRSELEHHAIPCLDKNKHF